MLDINILVISQKNKKMDILVIEDDPDVGHLLYRILSKRNFNVYTATNGEIASEYIQQQKFDLILLDVMLPKKKGTTILKEIRADKNTTPVILLTAIGTSEAIVEGLNNGADDYIVKPFKIDELIARINAVMRRSKTVSETKTKNQLQTENILLDDEAKKVWINQNEVQLTSKEFNLLKYFLENKGKVLHREQILENVWSVQFDVGTNIVDVYVNYLRKKLKAQDDQQFIETVVGMGYVLR